MLQGQRVNRLIIVACKWSLTTVSAHGYQHYVLALCTCNWHEKLAVTANASKLMLHQVQGPHEFLLRLRSVITDSQAVPVRACTRNAAVNLIVLRLKRSKRCGPAHLS